VNMESLAKTSEPGVARLLKPSFHGNHHSKKWPRLQPKESPFTQGLKSASGSLRR
jgi:hypothetical protein